MPVTKKTKKAARKKTTRPKSTQRGELFPDQTLKKKEITIGNKTLTFTNLGKIYWPKEKITKGDLLNYYHRVAPWMMPYLKDRPHSLNRLPNGISKPGFFQKDVKGKVPEWVDTYKYFSESNDEEIEFLVCTDEPALLYMANLGCIEINPWSSTIHKPDNPDWCVIDLDPGNIAFEKVIETAQVIKQITDEAGIKACCKTSGATGMHVYIPLGAQYSYEQSRQLAELLVNLVHQELPAFTSLERSPKKRTNKIYLDFLQNSSVQTVAAPYSCRPKPGASVSAPLHWDEVKKGLRVQDFTIHNMPGRLQEMGDIFKPVLGKGISLKKVMNSISKLLKAQSARGKAQGVRI